MKKKVVSILLCAAMGMTALAGCGNSSGSGSAASEPAAAVQEESRESTEEATQAGESQESAAAENTAVDGGGETLNVMCHSSWRTDEANAVFDYVAEKCNVKFEFEEVPRAVPGMSLFLQKCKPSPGYPLVAGSEDERNGNRGRFIYGTVRGLDEGL
ncbi:MAG: hypothetical protein ACLUOI_09400 [Eisenbergiella sp.]